MVVAVAVQPVPHRNPPHSPTSSKPLTDAPLIALLAWTEKGLWGVTPHGKVYVSTDAGTNWRKTGQVTGETSALAASRTHLNVLAGDTIWESLDQGTTFTPRVTGIPGH